MINEQLTSQEQVMGWSAEITLHLTSATEGILVMLDMVANREIWASFLGDAEVCGEYLMSVEIRIPLSLVVDLGFGDYLGDDLQWTLYGLSDAFVDEATAHVRSRAIN